MWACSLFGVRRYSAEEKKKINNETLYSLRFYTVLIIHASHTSNVFDCFLLLNIIATLLNINRTHCLITIDGVTKEKLLCIFSFFAATKGVPKEIG